MTADEGPSSRVGGDEPSGDDTPSTSPSTERSTASSDGESDGADGHEEGGGTSPDQTAEPVTDPESGDESRPSPEAGDGETGRRAPNPVPDSEEEQSYLSQVWYAETGPLFLLREVATSAGAVLLVGLVLFAVSGVWPPMVAVESGSMEPHMQKGDLVFITEPGRYTPDAAYESTGVVTAKTGEQMGYRTFGGPGSVIVYDDPRRRGPPIIHRAVFYVEEGENWYNRTNPQFVSADDCDELRNCPAPHAGFITKGDANSRYDQASNIAEPVKPVWITGIARVRIPYLGWVRLGLADVVHTGALEMVTSESRQQVGSVQRPERKHRLSEWSGPGIERGTRATLSGQGRPV